MSRTRNRHLLLLDAVLLGVSPLLLYVLRFEGVHWGQNDLQIALTYSALSVPVRLLIFYSFGLYRRLWRYASVAEMELIFVAAVTASVVCTILGAVIMPALGIIPSRVPLSVLFNNGILSIGLVAAPRFLIRMGGWRSAIQNMNAHGTRVLIAGAGTAGHMLAREMRQNHDLNMYPVGFVDDDPTKHGLQLANLPVFGPLSATGEIVRGEHIDVVVIAMPSAAGSVVRPVVRAALDAGAKTRTVPSLSEIISGAGRVAELRDVELSDLLRREPVQTDLGGVSNMISDHTVLVTGAGGSIGSELCRQIAQLDPAKLVLLGHGENPIFDILHELRPTFPALNIVPVIADVRDRRRLLQVFEKHRPFSVFHAAAHKHVPLMEENVIEAVTNNVIGTHNVVDAAVKCGANHFVFISTDKAVRPTNVMGATKRVAEHVVQQAAIAHRKNFVAVRFGNVLGSRGSVIPTFVRQIKEGGPVTVTHPEMRRYFMTIPEAVQLVLQAGALGKGGELFMLDMGEPVRVVDLARDLIRLSGLDEGTDVKITFTGIRPGEKLYEEMFFSDEVAAPTEHPKVLRARKESLETWGSHLIAQLIEAASGDNCCEDDLRHMLQAIVPDFVYDAPTASMPTPSFGVSAQVPEKRRASNPAARPN